MEASLKQLFGQGEQNFHIMINFPTLVIQLENEEINTFGGYVACGKQAGKYGTTVLHHWTQHKTKMHENIKNV